MPRPTTSAAALLIALLSLPASAMDEAMLEQGLAGALSYDKKTHERAADSGKAIQAYMREGYVNKRPNRRADYTDYYVVNKPARFMGHDLVLIEEEYMTAFIGCCVSEGMGITVRTNGPTAALEAFAEANSCRVEERVNMADKMSSVGLKASFPKGEYVSLSCRARDAEH